MDSAISGLMNYLGDKYTTYLDTNDTSSLNTKLAGEYTGIGVSLSDNGVIKEIFDDSPAEKGGLEVNDKIIAINDSSVTEKTNSEIASLIKDSTNKNVKVTILRNNQNQDYNIAVDTLYIPAISTNIYNQNNKTIGYLYISTFYSYYYYYIYYFVYRVTTYIGCSGYNSNIMLIYTVLRGSYTNAPQQ